MDDKVVEEEARIEKIKSGNQLLKKFKKKKSKDSLNNNNTNNTFSNNFEDITDNSTTIETTTTTDNITQSDQLKPLDTTISRISDLKSQEEDSSPISPAPLYNEIVTSYANNSSKASLPNSNSSPLLKNVFSLNSGFPQKSHELNIFNEYDNSSISYHVSGEQTIENTNIDENDAASLIPAQTTIFDEPEEEFSELLVSNETLDNLGLSHGSEYHDNNTEENNINLIKEIEDRVKFERIARESVEQDLENTKGLLALSSRDLEAERKSRLETERKFVDLKNANEKLNDEIVRLKDVAGKIRKEEAMKEGRADLENKLEFLHRELRAENERLLEQVRKMSDERKLHLEQLGVYQENVYSLEKQINELKAAGGVTVDKEFMKPSVVIPNILEEEVERLKSLINTKIKEGQQVQSESDATIKQLKDEILSQKKILSMKEEKIAQLNKDQRDLLKTEEAEANESMKIKYRMLQRENEKFQETLQSQFAEISLLKRELEDTRARIETEGNSSNWKSRYVDSCVKLTELIKQRRNLMYLVESMKQRMVSSEEDKVKSESFDNRRSVRYLEQMEKEHAALEEKNQSLLKIIAKLTNLNWEQEQRIARLSIRSPAHDLERNEFASSRVDSHKTIRVAWTIPSETEQASIEDGLLEDISKVRKTIDMQRCL